MKKQDPNNSNEDRRLLLWLSVAGTVISLISLVINYLLEVKLSLILITYGGIITYGTLIIAIRKGLSITISQNLIVFITLIFTNILWYYEHGSDGPILYFFILIFTLIIFVWSGRKLLIGSLILLLNLILCFYIDYKYPNFVPSYSNELTRTIDVYSSIILFGIAIYALMLAVKKSYAKEYEKALQSDKLKTSFLENISHEVRTPLNAIIGFSELLKDNKLTKEQREEYNSLINDSNETLLRVIDDVLQVSLLETDHLPTNINDCELNKMLNGLFKTYSKTLIKNEKSDISLGISGSTSNAVIKADKIRLQQVFINLLDNAIKFTHSGNIDFGYIIEKTNVLFHVKDTGIGIKTKHQNIIFDRFHKVNDNNSQLYRGTGIGLFLAKKIVEANGGEIWVDSDYGSGSTFYFTLPKTGYREIDDKLEKSVIPEKTYNLEGKNILIVEDQPSSQIFFKNLLTKSGVNVIQAWNGSEAVKLAKLHLDINLILMDIRLPTYSGYEAFEEIRKFNKHIPIIAQTAFGMKQDEKACLDIGFNDYISKPIKSTVLLQKISDALN